MSLVLETMFAGDEVRQIYTIGSAKAAESIKVVEDVFGKQDWVNFVAIGTPSFNAAFQMNVVAAIYGVVPNYLHDAGGRLAERKFHLDTKMVYEKMFMPTPTGYVFPPLPPSAAVIAIAVNHRIAGMDGDASVEDVHDVYFSADCAEAEQFFQLPEQRGKWKTYYGVSFHKDTKEVLRVKTYAYDYENGPGNWEQILEIALTAGNGV